MTAETRQQQEMTLGEALALANQAQQHGQLAEAEEIYGRVLEAWPECPDALHFSGLLAFAKGKPEEAVTLVERSVELAPDHPDFWNNFGNVLKALERIPEATAAYERAIALRPGFADAHNNLGVLAGLQEDFAGAVSQYQKAIAANPNRADTHLNLGNALEKLDLFDESVAAFRTAIQLAPADPNAYGRLGHILWRQGKFEEATEAISQHIQLNPRDARCFAVLAGIFYQQGRLEEAFEAYRKALEIEPTNSYANLLFGQMLTASGRANEARAVWQRWSEADPENPIPRHLMAAGADGAVPERSGDDFIVKVFDSFADNFDKKLKHLDYKAPQFVADAVRDIFPQPAANLDILDAGCGTGLCGPLLRPFARCLDGVDLSERMLDKARERGGYDELVAAELTAFIQQRKDCYDVIVSADTLCYFGRLEAVFAAAAEALRPNGHLIFTVEKTPASTQAESVTLEHSGRYTHTEAYIGSAIAGSGLHLAQLECKTLRTEFFKPVEGMVVVAQKQGGPAATKDAR